MEIEDSMQIEEDLIIKNNLRQLVAKTGMKHSFIADKVKVSYTGFSYWINKHRNPTGIYAQRLEVFLNLDKGELFQDDDWMAENGN